MDKLKKITTEDIEEVEITLRYNSSHQVMIETNISDSIGALSFREFCETLKVSRRPLEVLCFLKEHRMENDVKNIAESQEVYHQIYFTGKLNPTFISPWEREKVVYNIENILPNLKATAQLKKAHFDVVHYFCQKLLVKELCVTKYRLSEVFISLCLQNNITLSVRGDYTLEEVDQLLEMGIYRVISTNLLTSTTLK